MDSVLPPILLAAAGLLAAYVCVRSFLRVLPPALTRTMQRLRDSVEQDVARRKLPHGQHQVANTRRLVAAKKRLLDQLHTRWRARTGEAPVVTAQTDDPEWNALIDQLDEVDRDLAQQDEVAGQRYRQETDEALAGFDRSVRRLWWLNGADLALFLTSGAVLLWVVGTLYELMV